MALNISRQYLLTNSTTPIDTMIYVGATLISSGINRTLRQGKKMIPNLLAKISAIACGIIAILPLEISMVKITKTKQFEENFNDAVKSKKGSKLAKVIIFLMLNAGCKNISVNNEAFVYGQINNFESRRI